MIVMPLRVGLLYPYPDPTSPRNWSGTPNGLATGMAANNVTVVPIGGGIPTLLHYGLIGLSRVNVRAATVARRRSAVAALRTQEVGRQLSAALPLDALIAMDTEAFALRGVLPAGVPIGTYDDGSFALFSRHQDSDVRRSGIPDRVVQGWVERQKDACQLATACFLSTSWAAQSIVKDYGVPADRVKVVGMGHRPRNTVHVRRDWSVPRYLFVGVDWGRKNGEAVLKSFAKVRDSHPYATLDVVGRHAPISQPGVIDHGLLERNDPAAQRLLDDLFARCTAFVLPSRFDPSPIAYLEAASAGLPVIATTEGGAGELLGDGAITVHPDDHDGLLKGMLTLADPATAESFGAEAARRSADATWTAVARRILNALELGPGMSDVASET